MVRFRVLSVSDRNECHYDYDGESRSTTPIITFEVTSDTSSQEADHVPEENPIEDLESKNGIHFANENPETSTEEVNNDESDGSKARNDLLEYMMRNDGSVVCKLCGEILQSRTHWYRHKYKLHVIQPLNPAPLFQCEHCLVYFKSRKGYIGHIASRHSEVLADSSPVLTNTQAEAIAKEVLSTENSTAKHDSDPELSIPKTSVPNYQTTAVVKQAPPKNSESKRQRRCSRGDQTNMVNWEEKRCREEKLVADIIDRVRRECEAQGSGGAARRGYTRRTTVMHT